MRISERGRLAGSVAALLIGLTLLQPAAPARAAEIEFKSPEAAFDQGISAYRNGRYRMAVQALEFAAKAEHFRAQYYLGRIYSNSSTSLDLANHGRAYLIFKHLVDRSPFVDRYTDPRASYIAKSYVQLAIYNRSGLDTPEVKFAKNPQEAMRLLEIAANVYDDKDAQFELANIYLSGNNASSEDVARGKDRLVRLAKGYHHAGAQAFLAELHWRGKHFPMDKETALFWISSAMMNATEYDRFWIEELYQVIYCGTPAEKRENPQTAVLSWHKSIPAQQPDPIGPVAPTVQSLAATTSLWSAPLRTCPDNSEVKRLPARR
jgi:TPR repeat protein